MSAKKATQPVTGRYTVKLYKCKVCGFSKSIGTNHWGECYSLGSYNHCPQCPPITATVWVCEEKPPKGYGKPEPWRMVKLGDLVKIKGGKE